MAFNTLIKYTGCRPWWHAILLTPFTGTGVKFLVSLLKNIHIVFSVYVVGATKRTTENSHYCAVVIHVTIIFRLKRVKNFIFYPLTIFFHYSGKKVPPPHNSSNQKNKSKNYKNLFVFSFHKNLNLIIATLSLSFPAMFLNTIKKNCRISFPAV